MKKLAKERERAKEIADERAKERERAKEIAKQLVNKNERPSKPESKQLGDVGLTEDDDQTILDCKRAIPDVDPLIQTSGGLHEVYCCKDQEECERAKEIYKELARKLAKVRECAKKIAKERERAKKLAKELVNKLAQEGERAGKLAKEIAEKRAKVREGKSESPKRRELPIKLGDLGPTPDYNQTILDWKKLIPDFEKLIRLPKSYEAPYTVAKDQGEYCGSCWAFAIVGTMEAKILRIWGPELNLSEQQLISCATERGCCGWYMTALKFYERTGPMERSCTGYRDVTKRCQDAASTPCENLECQHLSYRMSGYQTVNTSDPDEIKTSIYFYGASPFRFVVHKDFRDFWRNANPGAVYRNNEDGDGDGHIVLIVGWDDYKQAWKCKNSGGETAGPNEDGTFWIAYSGHAKDLQFEMAFMKNATK